MSSQPTTTIRIEGYTELLRALHKYDRDLKAQFRAELKNAAGPVQKRAEVLAHDTIRHIGPTWSRMKIGVTSSVVYVAPKPKKTSTRKRKRPNMGHLLQHKALEPALAASQDEVRAALEAMLDRIGSEAGF